MRSLFDARPPSHTHDSETSFAAADRVRTSRKEVQKLVLRIFEDHGPLADAELHRIYERRVGHPVPYSTARTRRGELVRMGLLQDSGHRIQVDGTSGKSVVWELV